MNLFAMRFAAPTSMERYTKVNAVMYSRFVTATVRLAHKGHGSATGPTTHPGRRPRLGPLTCLCPRLVRISLQVRDDNILRNGCGRNLQDNS